MTTEYTKLMASLKALDEMRAGLADLGVDTMRDRDRVVRGIAMAIEAGDLGASATVELPDLEIVAFAKAVQDYMAARAMVAK